MQFLRNRMPSGITPVASGEVENFECQAHGMFVGRRMTFAKTGEILPACPTCLEASAADATREIALQRSANKSRSLLQKLGHSGVPKRFLRCTFENFEVPRKDQRAALDAARTFADDFPAKLDVGAGMLFLGKSGTGKTHLASAICKSVVSQGFSAVFASTLEFFQVVKETFSRSVDTSEREAIHQFAVPDLLVLDEVGVQYGTKAERMLMTELINQRYSAMRPTILLTNLTVDELGALLDFRVISRLREVNSLVLFDWPDYRLGDA